MEAGQRLLEPRALGVTTTCLFVGSAGDGPSRGWMQALAATGCRTERLDDPREARAIAAQRGFSLIVVDFDDVAGEPADLASQWPPSAAIAVLCRPDQTARARRSLGSSVVCIRTETDADDAAVLMQLCAETRVLRDELGRFASRPATIAVEELVVGVSPIMRRFAGAVRRAAELDATVLIEGREGTGKTLVARTIHGCGRRSGRPLVLLQCQTIDEEALAAALDSARGGTVVLEDVDTLPQSSQARLVRFLKERSSSAPASEQAARLVGTTAARLPELTAKGRFREDLYYRLNSFPLTLPALRERIDDIPILAKTFLRQAATAFGMGDGGLTPAALALLEANPWPGNVAQLRNAVLRASVLASGAPIDRIHLGSRVSGAQAPFDQPQVDAPPAPAPVALGEGDIVPFQDEEKRILERALRATRGNVRRAAELLGIGRATLYRKIQVYELSLS
jgi:DNA-binding NtrC family response regulator